MSAGLPLVAHVTDITESEPLLHQHLAHHPSPHVAYFYYLQELLLTGADKEVKRVILEALLENNTWPERHPEPTPALSGGTLSVIYPYREQLGSHVCGTRDSVSITTTNGHRLALSGLACAIPKGTKIPKHAEQLSTGHLAVNRPNTCPNGLPCCLNLLHHLDARLPEAGDVVWGIMCDASSAQVVVDAAGPLIACFIVDGCFVFNRARATTQAGSVVAPVSMPTPDSVALRSLLASNCFKREGDIIHCKLPSGSCFTCFYPLPSPELFTVLSGPCPLPTAFGWIIPRLLGAAAHSRPLASTPQQPGRLDRLPGIRAAACPVLARFKVTDLSVPVTDDMSVDESMFSY